MEIMKTKLRREEARNEILEKAKQFIDGKVFQRKEFFKKYPDYRSKMVYYFGSLAEFYDLIGAVPESKTFKELKQKVERKKTRSMRNELAAERLMELRLQGLTLEELGERYGVTKQAVQQLMIILDTDLS